MYSLFAKVTVLREKCLNSSGFVIGTNSCCEDDIWPDRACLQNMYFPVPCCTFYHKS